jgi:TPR repeat protein
MTRILLMVFAAMACSAHADVRMRDEMDAVSMPYAQWEVRFPGAGWTLDQQRRAQDGGQFYYMFHNFQKRLAVSFFLEPAYKCDSGEACRTKFWANPGAGYSNPANPRFFEAGPFSVVEFTTQNGAIVQQHWSAHAVHQGVWVDLHVSSVSDQPKDFSAFRAFADQLAIATKPGCPECFAAKGLPRAEAAVLFGKSRSGDKAALERLRELARSGDAEAQFTVARLYSWGSSLVPPDEKESLAWTRKAAEQGHPEAQSNLGYFYASGRGVESKSTQQAIRWWTSSADQGFAPAQLNLANLYATEPEVKDDSKAFEFFRKAADQGLAAAQLNLGLAYVRGTGTQKSIGDGLQWYRKAAMQGNETALTNMAFLYAMGGPQDPKLYETALTILSEPVLVGNKRAQELKSKICADNPASCFRMQNGP